ncbi:benzaldehyde dehydrogenase, partial [Streptomyces sp. NPDC052127]
MPLLDPQNWQSRTLSGPRYTVTEPATGDPLGTVDLAGAAAGGPAAGGAPAAHTPWGPGPPVVGGRV